MQRMKVKCQNNIYHSKIKPYHTVFIVLFARFIRFGRTKIQMIQNLALFHPNDLHLKCFISLCFSPMNQVTQLKWIWHFSDLWVLSDEPSHLVLSSFWFSILLSSFFLGFSPRYKVTQFFFLHMGFSPSFLLDSNCLLDLHFFYYYYYYMFCQMKTCQIITSPDYTSVSQRQLYVAKFVKITLETIDT